MGAPSVFSMGSSMGFAFIELAIILLIELPIVIPPPLMSGHEGDRQQPQQHGANTNTDPTHVYMYK